MRAKEFLSESKQLFEAALAKGDFGPQERKQDRIKNFIDMYINKKPFTLSDGSQIVLKKEAGIINQLVGLSTYDYLSFPSRFKSEDGRTVAISDIVKTKEFGGTGSKTDNPLGKEALSIKPSQIGISATATDKKDKFDIDSPDVLQKALATGAFPASQLAGKIQSDPILKSDPVGVKVIEMSKQISSGNVPNMPSRQELPNTALAAIRDYAGEYLGVQQLVDGTAVFPSKEDFFKFMNVDQESMGNLMLYFPKSTNTPLADSLALQNQATGHVLKLSAKGASKGAPPSLDNLKVPEEIRQKKNKEVAKVVKFLDVAKSSSAKIQPFKLAELLIQIAPETIPDSVKNIFPISEDEFNKLYATKKNPNAPCPRKFIKLANIKGSKGKTLSGTCYGRVHYQVNKVVIDAINKRNALPAFRKTALEILGYNFMQIFSRVRQNKLFADVLWPGKVNGTVEIYSKSSTADPDHQKISFSVTD